MPEDQSDFLKKVLKPPVLPANIADNEVFKVVPELFTGNVDGSQNHVKPLGFLSRVASAGLAVDPQGFFLEQVVRGTRTPFRVVSTRIDIEGDSVTVTTEDGREVTAKLETYRIDKVPTDGSPMSDLRSIDIFALTDNLDILRFQITKPDLADDTSTAPQNPS